jgi:hypothetical protein
MARQEGSGLTQALDLFINRSNQHGNIHFGLSTPPRLGHTLRLSDPPHSLG